MSCARSCKHLRSALSFPSLIPDGININDLIKHDGIDINNLIEHDVVDVNNLIKYGGKVQMLEHVEWIFL